MPAVPTPSTAAAAPTLQAAPSSFTKFLKDSFAGTVGEQGGQRAWRPELAAVRRSLAAAADAGCLHRYVPAAVPRTVGDVRAVPALPLPDPLCRRHRSDTGGTPLW